MLVYRIFVNIAFRVEKMNKMGLLTLAVLTVGTAAATAQESGRYVRKAVRPEFFIPEKELEKKQERLPEFPAIESGLIKVTDEGVMVRVSDSAADEPGSRQPAQKDARQPAKNKTVHLPYLVKKHNAPAAEPEEDLPEETTEAGQPVIVAPPAPKAVYRPEDGLGDGLSRDETYLRKEKAYEEDLKAMAETGAMPENAELDADLEKMNSTVSFSVD